MVNLAHNLLSIMLVIIGLFLAGYVIYLILKFHGRSIFKSLHFASSLKKEKKKDHDLFTEHLNRCTARATVEYRNSRKTILLHIPTKRIWEATTQMDIKKKIREMLESEDFREFLSDSFPNYRFETKPKYHNNEFIIRGTKF